MRRRAGARAAAARGARFWRFSARFSAPRRLGGEDDGACPALRFGAGGDIYCGDARDRCGAAYGGSRQTMGGAKLSVQQLPPAEFTGMAGPHCARVEGGGAAGHTDARYGARLPRTGSAQAETAGGSGVSRPALRPQRPHRRPVAALAGCRRSANPGCRSPHPGARGWRLARSQPGAGRRQRELPGLQYRPVSEPRARGQMGRGGCPREVPIFLRPHSGAACP